jgi:serine/threonine protein kinase
VAALMHHCAAACVPATTSVQLRPLRQQTQRAPPHPLPLIPATALEATAALARSHVGTPYYMSPELCEAKPYSYKSDVWSVGVVLYELASLRQPFGACVRACVRTMSIVKASPLFSHVHPSSSFVRTRWCSPLQRRRAIRGVRGAPPPARTVHTHICMRVYIRVRTPSLESMCVTTRMYLCAQKILKD